IQQSQKDRCRELQRFRATARAAWCPAPCDPSQPAIARQRSVVASDPPAPATCPDSLALSFPVSLGDIVHPTMVWDRGVRSARCDDANRLPQSLADKIRAVQTSECAWKDFPVALRRRKRLRQQTLLRGEECAYI